jgi:hypothetical protein
MADLSARPPATLRLKARSRRIVVNDHKHTDWIEHITIIKDSEVTLKPDFGCHNNRKKTAGRFMEASCRVKSDGANQYSSGWCGS